MNKEQEKRFRKWWSFFTRNQTYLENYTNPRDLELAKYFYEKGTEFGKEAHNKMKSVPSDELGEPYEEYGIE